MHSSDRKLRAFQKSRARKRAFSNYLEEQGFKIRGITDDMASDLGVNPTAFRRAISLKHIDDPESGRIHLFSAQLARNLESLFNLPEGYLEGGEEQPGTHFGSDSESFEQAMRVDEMRYQVKTDEVSIKSALEQIQGAVRQHDGLEKYPPAMRAAQISGAIMGHLERLISDIWEGTGKQGTDLDYISRKRASYRKLNLPGIYRSGELMIPYFYVVIRKEEYGGDVKNRLSLADILKSKFQQLMERNMFSCWSGGFELFNIVAYLEHSHSIVSASYKLSELGVIMAPSVVYPACATRLEDYFVTNPTAPKIFRESDIEL